MRDAFELVVLKACLVGIGSTLLFAFVRATLPTALRQASYAMHCAKGKGLAVLFPVVFALGMLVYGGSKSASPTNAPPALLSAPAMARASVGQTRIEKWFRRGAWEDGELVRFDDGWRFPYGTSHLQSVELWSQGAVFLSAKAPDAIVALPFPLALAPQETEVTYFRTADNAYRFEWRNAHPNRSANVTTNVAIELRRNGDCAIVTADAETLVPYAIPYPHDGIGQDDDWVRANLSRFQRLVPSATNADEIVAVGYTNWVNGQIGHNLTNGLYRLTADFPERPLEPTKLTVGDYMVVVTNAGVYAFVLAKGEEYEFDVDPFVEEVEYRIADDIDEEELLLRGVTNDWAPPNVWSRDGGWYWIDRPYDSGGIHYPGSVLWLPTLRGSPDFSDNWAQDFPRTFEAVLPDYCLAGEVSYQWSSWGLNVYFSEPTARVTGAEFRGFDFSGWYSPWMSVEANVCGYTLRSDVYIDDIPPDARQVSVTFAGSSHVWVDHPQDDANGRTWTVCIDSPVPTCGVFRVSYAGSSVHARVDFVGPQEIEIDESTTYPLERVLAVVKGIAPSDHCGEESFRWSFEGLDGVLVGTNRFTVCRVDAVELRLQKDGASVDPVSFPGQETAMFSITNSASPDRHYPIFFENVVDENARLLPYSVAYRVCLSPAEFELADAMTSLTLIDGPDSGTLRAAMGKTGYFDTPCEGGVYRIGVRYADSPPTETILLLPIAGASVDMVIKDDIERADEAVVYMMANYSAVQRQMPIFGLQWFNNDGMGDYLGRVDAIARPTEWLYNQVNDDTGMGAVATWCGSPVRMSKASNFLVGYTTRRLGVWGASRWMSQMIGTGNDESASMSWRAGVAVAESAVYDSTVRNMVTNAWKVSDRKERRLWPNLTPTDNHTSWHGISNFNYQFISPGFTERRPR